MKALLAICFITVCAREVFRKEGELNVAIILRGVCNNSAAITQTEQIAVNSAIWTVHQLNNSEIVPGLSFGVSIYKTCNESEEIDTIFQLYKKKHEDNLIGIVPTSKFSPRVQKFATLLNINVQEAVKCATPLIKASVALLVELQWSQITVIAPNQQLVNEFFQISRKKSICVEEFITDSNRRLTNRTFDHVVIFGCDNVLSLFQEATIKNAIVVPINFTVFTELPENTYLISSSNIEEEGIYTPTPQVLEVASPLVAFALLAKNTIHCDSCPKNVTFIPDFTQVIDLLKVGTTSINFYNIYHSDNSSSLDKVLTYNIFNGKIANSVIFNNTYKPSCTIENFSCRQKCKNFLNPVGMMNEHFEIRIRSESWVFAFVSLSLLGVALCIAILVFLLVYICRRNILDGNPVTSILLLLTVMLMYFSILPIALEGNHTTSESICLAKALSSTLSFSAAFSLILSRSILLATSSKEIGFMSHVPGAVQSFLCLFIFGVQAALSLQITNRCEDIFKGYAFIYLLSYNMMLLLLLLCLSPLTMKSQRNYKEGKYFTFTAIAISLLWSLWLPAYALLEEFKDFVLCFGLVSTASVILGVVFIPRTYLMTIAAARDKMTNLPSLATSSAIDIYRAGTQPIYDCVNVAAINAVTVARAGITLQQPDLYSCPNLPDSDFDFRCDSPIADDKVTRF